MLQTQRQATVNLGTARAGLVLAAAIAAAAVVGQLIAANPVSVPATGSAAGAVSAPAVVVPEITSRSAEFVTVGAATFSIWQTEAGQRREGSSNQPAPAVRDSGGAHKGGLIPQ